MPALLTETLFVNDPIERDLLCRASVREAIAIAIYLGIVEYLAARDYGIRYDLVSGPSQVAAGGSADYRIRVTNTGNQTSSGWQLRLGSVASVPHYDGSGAVGDFNGHRGHSERPGARSVDRDRRARYRAGICRGMVREGGRVDRWFGSAVPLAARGRAVAVTFDDDVTSCSMARKR